MVDFVRKPLFKKTAAGIAAVLIIYGIIGWASDGGSKGGVSFQTAKASRGDMVVQIAATGTLEPEEVVDVGAQISGRIVSFGKDISENSVDYGSIVEENSVVARIDDALYQADVAEAEAQVASAKAGVQRAEADLGQMNAKFACAERDWERAKKLGPSGALAQSSYDAYQAAFETAKANVDVGKAAILEAKASLTQAEKSLWRAQRNLEYCTIVSPVKGTVIDRRVSIGQTVSAGLNTPSLFLIAKDLKRMEIWVSVNEADIARVVPGQPVSFTVDALPDETFVGEVKKIRPSASMTQNVVTYTVEISTDNSRERLRPYLTANVRFEVARQNGVLVVPAAALNWTPTVAQVSPDYRAQAEREASEEQNSRAQEAPDASVRAGMTPAFVWIVSDGYVRPIQVWAGISDGVNTEIAGDLLAEGTEVVTGTQAVVVESSDATNPFTPKMPKPPKSAGGPGGAGGPPPV